jgi:catechol 2,3-dioxygenase-like lactoylglutathione lyase family enzyme
MLGSQAIVAFVPTRDVEKARTFYSDVLGLTFLADDGFALVFDANGIIVRVTRVRELVPSAFTILGWEVRDIHTFVSQLQSKGVLFEYPQFLQLSDDPVWTAPDGSKVAWFKDPDGNMLSISEHLIA